MEFLKQKISNFQNGKCLASFVISVVYDWLIVKKIIVILIMKLYSSYTYHTLLCCCSCIIPFIIL